ncbi:MAG: GNAT family N-acetyltransferase [Chloroflexales bacterium]|nr:GNAT family N-acetyltransferase [Chloroflexales bacterium]
MGGAAGPPMLIRRAAAGDQRAITAIIRAAGINPTGLHWQRFIVAEAGGRVVGTGQIKPHGDGSRELASLAVIPARQGEGIARVIICSLQRSASPPLYLTCAERLEGLYGRFGFQSLARAEMPPDLRRLHRIINGVLRVLRYPERLLVMRWDGG